MKTSTQASSRGKSEGSGSSSHSGGAVVLVLLIVGFVLLKKWLDKVP